MPRETILMTGLARIARIPFRLQQRRPFTPPKKALILKNCCISQVMLATPLLAALSKAYPDTRFDWAVSEWARPAIIGNPRITELIITGENSLYNQGWRDLLHISRLLRQENYDTCFIPSRSSQLALIARLAQIPQRIGLNIDGRGFAHTLPVSPAPDLQHEAEIYLTLAEAAQVPSDIIESVSMEFYPSDNARTAVTERLIDELDWLGDVPLIVIHPGGGINPIHPAADKQWPVERFVLLVNGLAKQHNARILLVGAESDRPIAEKIAGLSPTAVANWAGRTRLSEVGALAEVADLYIGHDAGPTHIAAAAGCPTIALFGPSDPNISRPYATKGEVHILWHPHEDSVFSWDQNVSVKEVLRTANQILG